MPMNPRLMRPYFSEPVIPATVPGAVSGISASTSITEQAAADVEWGETAGDGGSPVLRYNIYYSLDGGTTWSPGGESYNANSGLLGPALYLGGETVKVDVRAVNAIGEGPQADPNEQTTVTLSNSVPSAPTAFTVTSVAGYDIYAAWNQPTYDGGPNVTAYEYSYFVNGMESTGSASGSNYTVALNSMNGGQEVQVRVRASNSVGYGPWSDTLAATSQDVPSETNANATSSSTNQGAVTLTIDVPNANYSAITSYDVGYGTDGMSFPASFNYTDQAGSGSFNKEITGLTGGTSYYFRIRFKNAIGNAPWTTSNINSGASSTPPAQITDFTVNPNYSTNQWNTSWTAPANGGSNFTGYEIQEDSSNSFSSPTTTTTSMSPTDFAVSVADATRYFRIRANNSVGNGQWSSPITAYFTSVQLPQSVALTSGSSYTVPNGATTAVVWAVGGGESGYDDDNGTYGGGSGGVSKKQWAVSAGNTIDYSIGAGGPASFGSGQSTTVTFGGTTITGGGGTYGGATHSGGDSGANGQAGGYTYEGVSAGNRAVPDHSGLYAAISAAGGSTNPGKGGFAYPSPGFAGQVVITFS